MLQYNEGEYATMWVDTSLVITPTENSQENPTTPSEPEKPSQEPITPTTPTQETEKEPQTKENNQTNIEANNPKTGDSIILYVAIAGISVMGLITTIVIKKRKNK